jgi:hypothetical protein
MNTSNPTTVVLSKDAAEKIAAAMRKRGEKAGDYFSRTAGVVVAEKSYGGATTQDTDSAFWGAERYPGDRGVAFSPWGPERRSGVHGDLRRMIAGRQVKAGAGSVNRDLVIMGGVYSSPSEIKFRRLVAEQAQEQAQFTEDEKKLRAAMSGIDQKVARFVTDMRDYQARRGRQELKRLDSPEYVRQYEGMPEVPTQAGKYPWDVFAENPVNADTLARMAGEANLAPLLAKVRQPKSRQTPSARAGLREIISFLLREVARPPGQPEEIPWSPDALDYMRSRKATKKPRGVTDD